MIKELKERDDIVIKPVDKDSAVVVMDNVDYVEEVSRRQTVDSFTKHWNLTPRKNSALE